jgi:hypothetical protein
VTYAQRRRPQGPQEPAAKAAAASWRFWALAVPAALAIGITVLALGDHFIHTRNWIGIAAIFGSFVLLMLASDLTGARGSRLREAGNSLTALAVIAVALGGLFWIIFRHWPAPATYAAGVAYEALLALTWRGGYLVRRRLRWRKYKYPAEARQWERDAYALWPRREARR